MFDNPKKELERLQQELLDAEKQPEDYYTDEELEHLKDRYLRAYGNLNLYYQENECNFTVVNAGLVYQGIEALQNEGRFCKQNLDSSKPVYAAFDISSKDKMTDATAGVIFQFINGRMIICTSGVMSLMASAIFCATDIESECAIYIVS